MTHAEARRALGAEPHTSDAAVAEHLRDCAECRRYRDEMHEVERCLQQAIALGPRLPERTTGSEATPARAAVVPLRPRSAPSARWAMAASLLVGVLAVTLLWLLRPTDTLAHELVLHVEDEPRSWVAHEPVTPADLARVLGHAGVAIDAADVNYLRSCEFRGHHVPHMVLRTEHGPVTMVVLVDEHPHARTAFHEAGLRGVILPTPHGSLAVLAREGTDLEAAVVDVERQVHFL